MCHKGGKEIHFASCCPSSVRGYDSVKYVALSSDQVPDTADNGEPPQCIGTSPWRQTTFTRTRSPNLMLDGQGVKFQVESGATCNVVRLRYLNVTNENLQESSEVLQLYDKSKLTLLGQWTAELVIPKTGTRQRTSLTVVEDAPTAILGAMLSQKLGHITVHYQQLFSAMTETEVTTKVREQIICKFQSVSARTLESSAGKCLEVEPLVPAEQTPLRKVPLAVQDRLKAELIHLEELEVPERVTTPPKWVSRMVVAEKKDSQNIQLCIDPKPLNTALKWSLYPLLTLKDVLDQKSSLCAICETAFGTASWMKNQAYKP